MTSTQTPMTPLQDFYNDMLMTAVEGGINYWALIPEYELSDQSVNAHAKVVDYQENDIAVFDFMGHVTNWEAITEKIEKGETPVLSLTVDAIRKAVDSLALGRDDMPTRWQIQALTWLDDPQDADYDAGDADVIAQIALLGKVVYG